MNLSHQFPKHIEQRQQHQHNKQQHTLFEMRTDVNAVPHASLRSQILKNQVRGPERL